MKNQSGMSEYLKTKRVSSGLTQGDVATKLGYTSAQFVSNWERGLSLPPIVTLKKICGLYKISQDEMYSNLVDHSVRELKMDLEKKFYKKAKK
jgi:transcriptional regulator with XRE-family HTH domain